MDAEKLLKEKVVIYLEHLGIDKGQSHAYLFLLQHGPQTVLALSRGLSTGRTKLYPLLEDLATKQLVSIHERHYGTSYEAQPPVILEFLVSEKERKAEDLRSQLRAVAHTLEALQTQSPTTSRIVEYRGVDGLKQINFNLTKAKKEFRVFELANLSSHLGKHFAEKSRERYADSKLTSYDLTNDPYWELETNVTGYKDRSRARYIDPSVFKIEFETYIYNNCVALLSYEEDDIFGVEIYNEKLARQQTQIFNLLWSQAKVIK